MIKLTYVDDTLCPSPMLKSLQQLVDNYPISDDPYVKHLRRDRTFPARKQLEEVLKTKSTDSQKQLKDLHRRATELHQQLGCWASTFFLGACLEKLREKVIRYSNMVCSVEVEEDIFLYNLLSTLQQSTEPQYQSQEFDISQKAMALLEYLRQEYTNSMTGMIFVKERSTAAILAHLVSNHPHTRGYFMAKSFVGTSKFPRKQTLIDLADIKSQAAALADFRSRKNNLLVCTSVTEEGVDISAMNLVIRFDEPANFRAFIQSRGRARKVESKFVLMCGTNDPEGKYEKWKALEAEMISKYTDEKRRIEKMLEDEEMNDEDYDEVLSNDTTG